MAGTIQGHYTTRTKGEDMAVARNLFAFTMSEVKTARIICKHTGCGIITEVPVEQLTVRFGPNVAQCPHCRGILCTPSQAQPMTPLFMLAFITSEAGKKDAMFDIEFALPNKTGG